MKYISTRGEAPALNFEDVLLTGLASDGGLYVPEFWPQFSAKEIRSWRGLAYHELAFKVLKPFVADTFDDEEFAIILRQTYEGFNHPAIAPLVQLDHNEFVLELFHGPTLAFKDFALQLLGRLLDKVLEKRGERLVIMGATSGDTGSAAIEGCKRCENIDIFILHPHQRVSDVQRRQMTTITGDNIYNLAIEGNFDDCQSMVKSSFRQQDFLRGERRLVAVNSINWARIMAQIVYYFYSALHLGGPDRPIAFSVPTGNFGDIFAGYVAQKMGLPISQLIVATNQNDILHRTLTSHRYEKLPLVHSLSPSMDIVVSSNFERLLFDLYDRNGVELRKLMEQMNETRVELDAERLAQAKPLFASDAVNEADTLSTIAAIHAATGYLLDPHTAIGVQAARRTRSNLTDPMVTLATAHPVKFAEAIEKAGLQTPALPEHLADLMQRPERFSVLPNEIHQVHDFISTKVFAK